MCFEISKNNVPKLNFLKKVYELATNLKLCEERYRNELL